MSKAPLGFGMMRLPVLSGPTDFDYDQLNQMVDEFIAGGFTYFDTSFVYHNGHSEEAAHKSLIERHPRDTFTIATKFPTFAIQSEDQVEPIFAQQLQNLGVDYVDYYLLHNIQTQYYDGLDGKGGIVKTARLFEHAKKWKEEGKIKHLGFSFHSSAKLLDRVLTEHPEAEFVQIALNYIDWESEFVQARECYEVIRKHGKKVVIMEPVKGGFLSNLPKAAADILHNANPNASQASWAIRFAGEKEGVLAVLSGMSSLEQVWDNVKTMQNFEPLSEAEEVVVKKAADAARDSGKYSMQYIGQFKGLMYHGMPVTAILQTANILPMQPDPGFADDNNYETNTILENSGKTMAGPFDPDEKVVLPDGSDHTAEVEEAFQYLKSLAF